MGPAHSCHPWEIRHVDGHYVGLAEVGHMPHAAIFPCGDAGQTMTPRAEADALLLSHATDLEIALQGIQTLVGTAPDNRSLEETLATLAEVRRIASSALAVATYEPPGADPAHTPEPWEIRFVDGRHVVIAQVGFMPHAAVFPRGSQEQMMTPQARADAQLMKEAPRLLAAIRSTWKASTPLEGIAYEVARARLASIAEAARAALAAVAVVE